MGKYFDRIRGEGLRQGEMVAVQPEEEYRLVSRDEEEVPYPYHTQDNDIPTTPSTYLVSEVRPKSASKCLLSNLSNSNSQYSGEKFPTNSPSNSGSSIPQRNTILGDGTKLPIFNRNGLEDHEQHYFF